MPPRRFQFTVSNVGESEIILIAFAFQVKMSHPHTASQWQCSSAGSLQHLRLVHNVPVLPPKVAGREIMAVVQVRYVGLNFADMFACLGLYSATPEGCFVPGLEYSGTIEAFCDERGVPNADIRTDETSRLSVGDDVLGVTRFGGYTTKIIAELRYVRKLPVGWNHAQGASFACQALTAWYGLVELGAIKKGNAALIHSGAGGTGLWALKICHLLDVRAITTVSTNEKAEELSALLPWLDRSAIVVRNEVFHNRRWRVASQSPIKMTLAQAMAKNGVQHFNLVFDSLLGEWFQPSHELLGPQGRHIVLGAGSMTPHGDTPNWLQLGLRYLMRPRLDPLAMISTNKSVMAFNLIWLYENADDIGRLFNDLFSVADALGAPHVGLELPFEQAIAALKVFQSGTTVGKCILRVE
jgi:synaptic vesicle membrane protein VAT-1